MESADRLRVVVAEDNEDLRSLNQTLVPDEPDLNCVAAVSSIDAVLDAGQRLTPQVIFLDIELEGESRLRSLPRIQAACRDTRVLISSGHVHPGIVRGALEAGAVAYVPRNRDVGELLSAIRHAGPSR